MARIKIRRSGLIVMTMLGLAVLSGCSTVSGFGGFVGGIGRDITDTAEGTRDKMKENGKHR